MGHVESQENNLEEAPEGTVAAVSQLVVEAGKVVTATGQILTAGTILVLLFLTLRWRVGPRLQGSFKEKPRLDIKRFSDWTENQEIGKGLAAMVRDKFKDAMVLKDCPLKAHLVEGPVSFEAPAEIKSVATPIKIVSDFIEWAFPQKTIIFQGDVQQPGKRGAGLTLKLVNNQTSEVIDSCTLWEKDYTSSASKKKSRSKCSPYYCLAQPAANWTLFQLVKYREREEIGNDPEGIGDREEKVESRLVSILGTDSWQSYLYFKIGLCLELEGNRSEAKNMYTEALREDSKNRFALFNYGYLKIEEAAEEQKKSQEKTSETEKNKRKYTEKYEEALDMLERAEEIAEKYEQELDWLQWMEKTNGGKILGDNPKDEKTEKIHGDNLWYMAMFQIVAIHSYMGNCKDEKDRSENLHKATEKTIEALKTLLEKQGKMERLRRSVNWVTKKRLEEMKEILKYLEDMQPIIDIESAMALIGEGDGKATGLIEKAKTSPYFSERAEYNLGCYYSILGEKKDALEHLRLAFRKGGDNVRWAQLDPDLRGVRDDDEFKHMIRKYGAEMEDTLKPT